VDLADFVDALEQLTLAFSLDGELKIFRLKHQL
jgi:hypothetical protein